MQGTMPGARRRGRPRTAWMDNIKTCTDTTENENLHHGQRSAVGKVTVGQALHWPCVLFCSSAVLDPRVGHPMDVLSLFIPVLCHSD